MEIREETVAASIDILGMGNILESINGSKRALMIIENIFTNTSDTYAYQLPDLRPVRIYRETLKFGDSIYIIGDPDQTIENQTQNIIVRIALLMAMGIYRGEFFLRCGIAKGNLITTHLKIPKDAPKHIQNITEKFSIGNSMYRAYKLEKSQEWVGGAIQGNINCSQMKYVVKYDVPLKNEIYEASYRPQYAINWIRIAKQNPKLCGVNIDKSFTYNIIDALANSIGEVNENVKKKIQNTKDFVDKVLDEN